MNTVLLAYIILFSFSTLACLVSIPRARNIQHPGTSEGMVVFLLSVALWSVGYIGYLLAPSVGAKHAFYIFGFVFAFVSVGAWLYFCAAYTGRPPRQVPYRNLLVAVFLVFTALKVTNPLHSLYFTTEWTTEPFPHLAIHHEILYWVLLGLSYAVIAVGFFMLLERFYHTGSDSRPLVALLGLTAVPAVVTIFGEQLGGVLPLMYEPPGVALFALGTLFVYDQRFEAIRLTGESNKPAIFLDQDTRIRDYNQAAENLLPTLHGSIGQPMASVSSSLEDHSEGGVISVSRGDDTRFYEISSNPFTMGGIQTGELVTITDVTDRESYQRELEEKTEQLEALNRVVRHDIRNDMAVVRGWAETLQDHVDAEGTEALDRVLRKSQHVIDLTESAREFTESLSGEGALEVKPIDLYPVLDSEIAAVRDSYPDATIDVPDEIPHASVQANEMLNSVFRNILENGIRHSDRETPEITITFDEGRERIQIRIADNGPGVPDDQKERIFGKGQKGLDSPGTGIGLYLVHTLTDQFGGDAWVEDNQPEGAVFVVELLKVD